MPSLAEMRSQAVTGVVPPQLGEAKIREVWPSVMTVPAIASLARVLMLSRIGAPLGWLLLAPLYFKKLLALGPLSGLAVRYTLTNRRLMIQHGLKPYPVAEIPLAEIDDVRLVESTACKFYLSATLEIISKGQVRMTLPAVKGPESFQHAILNACRAWVPEKAKQIPFVPASAKPAG
jgi:hypothetical protein